MGCVLNPFPNLATALAVGLIRLTGQLGGTAMSPDARGVRETGGPKFGGGGVSPVLAWAQVRIPTP